VAVHLFFNPDLVGQLAACGITARRRSLPGTPRRDSCWRADAVRQALVVTPKSHALLDQLTWPCTVTTLVTASRVRNGRGRTVARRGRAVDRQREQDLDDSAKCFLLLELDL